MLAQVRSGDGELVWASLANCLVGDKKLRKLVDAVKHAGESCALTSLDLSSNLLSDASAAVLGTAVSAPTP